MNKLKLMHDIKGIINLVFIHLMKDRKIIIASLIIGFIAAMAYTKAYSDDIQGDIADRVLRLHILAESDCEYDQRLKLKVRDRIIEKLQNELKRSKSKAETMEIIKDNIENIKKWGKEVIEEEGFDYDINAEICVDYFPTKKYGNVSLPNGKYDALRVTIGKGEGHNWWCVMYPPLCFVDVSESKIGVQEDKRLRESLTEEEYGLVTGESEELKIKFKIIELFEGI